MPPTPNDESSTEDPNEESSSDQESSSDAGESSSSDGESSSSSDSESSDDLTGDWKQERTKLRAEAANYRTRLREAERKLADAKTPEEVEAIVNELKETRETESRDLLVENVALKFKLPEKLAARLRGNTREELEADAAELAEFARIEVDDPDDLNGGLNPKHNRDGDSDDPGKLAAEYSSRGRQRARVNRRT